MKVSKPKDNQILIEDEALRDFELECETKAIPLDSEMNELYEGLILGYRLPGMTSSKQILAANGISLMTLIASMLDNGIRYGIIDMNMVTRLPYLINSAKELKEDE